MKKFLVMLSFLGMTTTGFAQISEINFAGRASLDYVSDKMIVIGCNGEGTCAKIIADERGQIHLLVPAFQLDLILAPTSTVNGTPIENLPPEMPNGDYQFELKDEKADE